MILQASAPLMVLMEKQGFAGDGMAELGAGNWAPSLGPCGFNLALYETTSLNLCEI